MSEPNESGDWRSEFNVKERWGEARKRNLFTDANFTVGDGESARSFSAHKNVLAFCSPVSEAMFNAALAETQNHIPIDDIDRGAFEAHLRSAYGEKISFPRLHFADKTHVVADKNLITALQAMADEHISQAMMDDKHFWEVIQQDEFFCIPVVKQKCLDHIAQNAVSLFKSDLFTSVSNNVIQEILQMDKLLIIEFELLSAVVRWGIGNIQPEKSLKSTLGPFLRYIRFSNFTEEDFCKFLDGHPGLLNNDDSLAIMKHLHNPSVYELPEWCSKSTIKRHQAMHDFRWRCPKNP